MTPFKLHPEISCPLCRIGFGQLYTKEEYKHVDIFFTQEGGISSKCSNPDYAKQHTTENERGFLDWDSDSENKLKEIKKQNQDDPDYSNQNCKWEEFYFVMIELIHWTDLSFVKDDESIKPMDFYKVKEMFEEGKTVKEIIQFYVVKDD